MGHCKGAALLIVTSMSIVGCVSPNREGAAALASDGQKLALGLQAETVAAADEFRKLPNQIVVGTVAALCKARNADAAKCRTLALSKELDFASAYSEARGVAALLDDRARVYLALHALYGSLGTEAAYDARADLKASVGQLVETTSGFVGTAAKVAGAPAVTESATFLLKTLAETWAAAKADRDQTIRLESANNTILAALAALKAGLAAEREYQVAARGVLGTEAGLFLAQLTEDEFLRYAPTLQSYLPATSTLPSDAEQKIRNLPGVRYGILRALRENALVSFDAAELNYAAILSGVDGLEAAHRQYQARGSFEVEDATRLIGGLAAAVERWNELKAQEAAARKAVAEAAAKETAKQ